MSTEFLHSFQPDQTYVTSDSSITVAWEGWRVLEIFFYQLIQITASNLEDFIKLVKRIVG